MKLERARKMRLALLAEMEKSNPTQPTPPTEDDAFGFAIPRNAGSPSTTSSSSESSSSSSGSSSGSSSSGSSSDSSSSTIVKKKTVVLAVPKRGTRYAPMKSMKTMEQVRARVIESSSESEGENYRPVRAKSQRNNSKETPNYVLDPSKIEAVLNMIHR
jgi:hypothetical protein